MQAAPAEDMLAVAVFARAPVPGAAKTRLIPLLGPEGAALLQAQLIARSLRTACAVPQAQVTLWTAGDTAHPVIAQQAAQWGLRVEAQRGADLGARMHAAFAQSLQQRQRCVLIGTDCPALQPAHLQQAAALLQDHDAVIQPAHDGGYVLIALRAPQPALFEGIAWGTDTVMQTTQDRIAMLKLRAALLPALPDLDTPEDYHAAAAQGWITALASVPSLPTSPASPA